MQPDFITIQEIQPTLEDASDYVILDVRETSEFRGEHVQNSMHAPLSNLKSHLPSLTSKHTYYILCHSGTRACKAAIELQAHGITDFKVIEGGLQAWKQAGLATIKSATSIWSLERQVRFAAGLFMSTGLLIGHFLHPMGFILSAFIGAGLMFSALTNTCGMGMVIAKFPWNK